MIGFVSDMTQQEIEVILSRQLFSYLMIPIFLQEHTDDDLDRLFGQATASFQPRFEVRPGVEGASFALGS